MEVAVRLAVLTAAALASTTFGKDDGFQMWSSTFGPSVAHQSHEMSASHFVTVNYGAIRFFTRDGELTHDQTMNSFVPTCGMKETVMRFDPYGRRFLVFGFGTKTGCHNHLVLAVSNSEDPNEGWSLQIVPPASIGAGYPLSAPSPVFLSIGLDAENVYLTWDTHSPIFPEHEKSWLLAFDRDSLLNGNPIKKGLKTNDLRVAYAAAKTFGEAPAQYLATTYGQLIGTTRVTLTAVRSALDAPIVDHFILDVAPFDYGPHFTVPTVDSDGLEALGVRVLRAFYRDGSLWITHHGIPAGEDRLLAMWYEFEMNGWPVSGESPTLAQQGVIDLGPRIHTWIPDLAVDEHGTVVFAFARSAANELQAVGSAFRRASDPPGTLQGFKIVKSSEFTNPFSGTLKHAYMSSVTEDPDVAGVFSVGGTYRINSSFGGVTRAMWAVPLITSVAGDLNGDGSVGVADLLILLAAWGGPCDDAENCPADLDGDGVVGVTDLLILLANWG